jgi:AraC family transcriptional regulator
MSDVKTGQFFGHNNQLGKFADVTVTETEFQYKFIDWHRHENSYFSVVTAGHCLESDRRKTYHCSTNSLLFHNAQQAHYNKKAGDVSLGFQIEIDQGWYKKFELRPDDLPAMVQIDHPSIKILVHNIYKEARLGTAYAGMTADLTVDALLLEAFDVFGGIESSRTFDRTPRWVKKLDEILREDHERPLSLLALSAELGVHWAHLSRDFPRYFRCNFSQYLRKIRVERSLGMLRKRSLTMADIACKCGFADQSHFIRCFKQYTGLTPKNFRKIIL